MPAGRYSPAFPELLGEMPLPWGSIRRACDPPAAQAVFQQKFQAVAAGEVPARHLAGVLHQHVGHQLATAFSLSAAAIQGD